MSLKNAWLGLLGKQEPVYLVGQASMETVYKVETIDVFGAWLFATYGRFYATCEQAHKSNPGQTVLAVEALRIGKELYILPKDSRLRRVAFEPKPKVAKGRK